MEFSVFFKNIFPPGSIEWGGERGRYVASMTDGATVRQVGNLVS